MYKMYVSVKNKQTEVNVDEKGECNHSFRMRTIQFTANDRSRCVRMGIQKKF